MDFSSAGKYFDSFVYPLLNETRIQLSSSMEVLKTSPYARVVSLERPSDSDSFGSRNVYCVKTDTWKNRSPGHGDHGEELYKTSPGDVFILTDFKPETVNDLQSNDRMWSFVLSLARVLNEENDNDTKLKSTFNVIASKDIDGMGQKSLFIIFLTNITPTRRIWTSLHMDGNVNSKLFQKILCASDVVREFFFFYVKDSIKYCFKVYKYDNSCSHHRIIVVFYLYYTLI
jgi:hypothetical protein